MKCDLRKVELGLSISNLNSKPIIIDLKADVDLTNFIRTLSKRINKSEKIEIYVEDNSLDEKEKLVVGTLKDIIDKYNEVIDEVIDEGIKDGLNDRQVF